MRSRVTIVEGEIARLERLLTNFSSSRGHGNSPRQVTWRRLVRESRLPGRNVFATDHLEVTTESTTEA